jgi:hypothetical protein
VLTFFEQCGWVSRLPLSTFTLSSRIRLLKMAPYDSDSSDDDDNDYTVTNVLLGYTAKEAKDDTISHLGGRPVCAIVTFSLIYERFFWGGGGSIENRKTVLTFSLL